MFLTTKTQYTNTKNISWIKKPYKYYHTDQITADELYL